MHNALNFLLGVGLFKTLKAPNGALSFRAVTKGELIVWVSFGKSKELEILISLLCRTKDLSGEENLVLGHIKTSGNEGNVHDNNLQPSDDRLDRHLDQAFKDQD